MRVATLPSHRLAPIARGARGSMRGLGQQQAIDDLNNAGDAIDSTASTLDSLGVDPSITSALSDASYTLSQVSGAIDQATSQNLPVSSIPPMTAAPASSGISTPVLLGIGGLALVALFAFK